MKIQLIANGKKYQGWQNITINRSMLSIADTFSMSIYNGDEIDINGGDSIQIFKDGVPFLTGYVDTYKLSIADSKRPLQISGRSKSCDLVDCNIVENKQYINSTPLQIIEDLINVFDLTVSSSLTLDTIELFETKNNETFFNAINRLCKQTNTLPISDEYGNITITKNENNTSDIVLKDEDLLTLDFSQDYSNRYSSYTYRKEAIVTDVTDFTSEDEDITRYRPFVDTNSEDRTNEDLANWKNNNSKAKSLNLSCSLNSWDYDINTIISFDTEIVKGSFLIKDISYSKGDSGTISRLTLVDKGLFDV